MIHLCQLPVTLRLKAYRETYAKEIAAGKAYRISGRVDKWVSENQPTIRDWIAADGR